MAEPTHLKNNEKVKLDHLPNKNRDDEPSKNIWVETT